MIKSAVALRAFDPEINKVYYLFDLEEFKVRNVIYKGFYECTFCDSVEHEDHFFLMDDGEQECTMEELTDGINYMLFYTKKDAEESLIYHIKQTIKYEKKEIKDMFNVKKQKEKKILKLEILLARKIK